MSDQAYRKQYFSLVKKLQAAGLIYVRRVFWYCPASWACHRKAQIAAMRQALANITEA